MVHRTLMLLVLFTITLFSQQNKNQLNLNSDYEMKIGDYGALLLNEFLKANTALDAPILSTFNPETSTIDLNIYGGRGTVEGGRETVNNYLDNIETSFIPYIKKRFNIALNKNDFKIFYYDRTAQSGYKLIIQLLDGQYVIPSN